MRRVAILSITRGGTAVAARIAASLPGSRHLVLRRFAALAPGAEPCDDVAQAAGEAFETADGLVCVFSLGAAVRLLAPRLRDKRTDPGVVVVDEAGRWAIAVTSGHQGGANDLARQVAALLGAEAVISTASDARGLPALDLLGREYGWRVEAWEHVTAASAALLNGEPVAVFQEAGETDWRDLSATLPANLVSVATLEEAADPRYAAALAITDRALPSEVLARFRHLVIYRPRSLVVGIGCRRGATAAEIATAVTTTLAAAGLSPLALHSLATSDRKANEAGLLAYAAAEGLGVAFFDTQVLNGVTVPHPSPIPLRHLGVQGVAEPAALASSGGALAVAKTKFGNCTVAVARVPVVPHKPAAPNCEASLPGSAGQVGKDGTLGRLPRAGQTANDSCGSGGGDGAGQTEVATEHDQDRLPYPPATGRAVAERLPDAVLLVGHGSPDPEGNDRFRDLAARFRTAQPGLPLQHCFIEHDEPTIARGIDLLVAGGARRISVLPGILLAAGHAKVDIPGELERARQRHPHATFACARTLGLDPLLLTVLRRQLRAAEAAAAPRERADTAVVLTGRGTSDPEANGDLYKLGRLLWEQSGYAAVECCFCGVTRPDFPTGVRRAVSLGVGRVIVLPFLLFTGVLLKRLGRQTAACANAHPAVEFCFAGSEGLGAHAEVLTVMRERLRELGTTQAEPADAGAGFAGVTG